MPAAQAAAAGRRRAARRYRRPSGADHRSNAHAATRLLGEAQHLTEAKPRSLADILGGEKRLEGLAAHVAGHASAGIDHADGDVVTGRRLLRIERQPER